LQLLQNWEDDNDDEPENDLKVSKEEREAYLAERAEKKRAQKRAHTLEYNKRPEVIARRKAYNKEYNKTKRQRNPVVARASNSQHSVSRPDFDEVS